ncbi:MAG TPA: hypothetical protein VEU33_46125, partial [Archangium sp.]|nr:hypothetical protein [Archangium sp.]
MPPFRGEYPLPLSGGSHIARDQRTNRRIRAREVRVVGPEGEQLGVLSIEAALERAQSAGMDLV